MRATPLVRLVVLVIVATVILIGGTAFAGPAHETVWVVSTVAGTPGIAGNADGAAGTATFNRPTWLGIATISLQGITPGDVFVIDRANNAIRRISHDGVFTYQIRQGFTDQTPVTFNFGGPFGGGIAVEPSDCGCGYGNYDSGMFVASSGSQQLALVSMQGLLGARDDVSPLIGVANTPGSRDGNAGSVYQPSSEAEFRTPSGLALSWGYTNATTSTTRRVYVADTGNHTVRQIAFGRSGENCPQTRTVVTMAGAAGQPGSADGVGSAARFNSPRGLAAGPDGSLYVADSGNHTIRRITPDGTVTTIAGQAGVSGSDDGPAREAHLNTPSGIAVNANGEIFLTDTGNHAIRMITTDGHLVTIAGLPATAGFSDGIGPAARFSGPVGITIAADGSLLVADTSNQVVRRLMLTDARANHPRAVRP